MVMNSSTNPWLNMIGRVGSIDTTLDSALGKLNADFAVLYLFFLYYPILGKEDNG